MSAPTQFASDAEIVAKIESLKFPKFEWPSRETHVPPRVLFVAGFKRTGKTTFAEDVASGEFRHDWAVSTNMLSAGYDKPALDFPADEFRGAPVVAFGDALRAAVYDVLNLPPKYDYEKNKEAPIVAGGKYTLRDAMIAVGSVGRRHDIAMWSKIALSKFFAPKTTTDGEENNVAPTRVICSDHRFVSEYEHAIGAGVSATTIRLFRRDVPVPPADIESEHDLDGFASNYLAVGIAPGHSDDISDVVASRQMAFEIWPQYVRYFSAFRVDENGHARVGIRK